MMFTRQAKKSDEYVCICYINEILYVTCVVFYQIFGRNGIFALCVFVYMNIFRCLVK